MNPYQHILGSVHFGHRLSWDELSRTPEFKTLVGLEEHSLWHPEGTTDKHLDQQADFIFKAGFPHYDHEILYLASLFHDLYKSVCWSKDEKGFVHNYGHEKLGARYFWDFIAKSGGVLSGEHLKMLVLVSRIIFWHMNKREDFYDSDRARYLVTSFPSIVDFWRLMKFYEIDSLSHPPPASLFTKMEDRWEKESGVFQKTTSSGSTTFAMMVGPSGSYKSTHAKKLEQAGYLLVSSDDIREEIHGDASNQADGAKVFAIARKRVVEGLLKGQNVVMDATNLTFKRRAEFLRLLQNHNVRVTMDVFLTTFDACVKAQENRERKVPVDVIKRQYESLELPAYCEANEIVFHWPLADRKEITALA